ncbi:AAA family ATPase [Hydrogenophaga sp.]|uniref:AAA family ATPase n=1 Tax=Hydrogenophaga sp. TaxID=1904254 RepID=UPI0019B68A71|nr:AAA family ATPase [Hydrogenophaga sp.]MBD3893397.1 chromosome segregation protein SMC [Hydrogenophaga sp.]
MTDSTFIRRVILRSYKSIARCDITLRPLTYLVGQNGAGKSNFLDALHFVRDALTGTLDNALSERGGLDEVRRRSSGHPNHVSIQLDLRLNDGRTALYAFKIGALPNGSYEVQSEQCAIGGLGQGPYYKIERGNLVQSSEATFPAVTPDRLALVAASGLTVFRPIYDALTAMGFYNLNPKVMRELQKPQDGRLLKPVGENIASVVHHLKRSAPQQLDLINEYLRTVVPMIQSMERKAVGPMETLEFRQAVAGAKHPWRFLAQNMSDGTLRALGVLTALLQGNADYSPSLIAIEEPETALHPAASGALREVLNQVAKKNQVLVTSHSPDLLDDMDIDADSIVAVISEEGATKLAPLDQASRDMLRQHLFSVGELLRMNQLAPDRAALDAQLKPQPDFFFEGE